MEEEQPSWFGGGGETKEDQPKRMGEEQLS
jgi:hypothetical protein